MNIERNYSFDLIRIIACMMVVLMHSPMPSDHVPGAIATSITYFTSPCIGLFFMTSGALLLPVKMDFSSFLRKRLNKVIWPTIIWSLIYLTLSYSSHSFNLSNLFHCLLSMPFSAQGNGIMWFMYTLIGLYFVAPIISPWLERCGKKELQTYLVICGVTFLYPYISLFLTTNESNTGILYYFTGYIGYFLLGYYLMRYPESVKLKYPLIISILGIIGLGYCKLRHIEIDFYSLFWYLSAPVVAMCMVWYITCVKIKERLSRLSTKSKNLIVKISNLSFGVYLCHIAFMRYGIWQISVIKQLNNFIFQTLIVFVLTIVISVFFLFLISKYSISKYLIGYIDKKSNIKNLIQ